MNSILIKFVLVKKVFDQIILKTISKISESNQVKLLPKFVDEIWGAKRLKVTCIIYYYKHKSPNFGLFITLISSRNSGIYFPKID